MKPYLFFDFDGLKFNTTPALVRYMNQRWNMNSVESDYVNRVHDIESVINKYRKDLNVTYSEAYEDMGKNYNSSLLWQQDVQPIENMCEIMKLLSKKYTLLTVTARQKAGIHVIQYLLDKYIPGCVTDIHCVYESIGNGKFNEVLKKDFIKSLTGEKVAFIDDSPKEIEDMQSTIPSYLFDPKRLHDNLTEIKNRVHSWNEIGEKFL